MTRRLIYAACLVILLLGVSSWNAQPAYACSCGPPDSLTEAVHGSVAAADTVFVGEVIAITEPDPIDDAQNDKRAAVQFAVQRVWKGSEQVQLTIHARHRNLSMCERSFVLGYSYLVYAYTIPGDDRLFARLHSCGLTQDLMEATEQITILEQYSQDGPGMPRAGRPSNHLLPMLLAPILAIALGLLVSIVRLTAIRFKRKY